MTIRKRFSVLFSLSLFLMSTVPLVAGSAQSEKAGQKNVAAASCQRCGDGYCAPSCENERTCPADCRSTKAEAASPAQPPAPVTAAAARCGRCGDGQCVKSCGETAQTCPVDCGQPSAVSSSSAKPADCSEPSQTAAKPKKDSGK